MELRKKPKVDYCLLANGPSTQFNKSAKPKVSWPSSQLWDIEILQTRGDAGNEEVLVHYIGWSGFDEWHWKKLSDVVDRNPANELSDAYSSFISTLKIGVKDNLNVSRVQDTEITVKTTVQRETYEQFINALQLKKWKTTGKKTIYRGSVAAFVPAFGKDWWYRICSQVGDFAYIVDNTIQLWLLERDCLTEYTVDLERRIAHRGYVASLRFVKQYGNSTDMNILKEPIT